MPCRCQVKKSAVDAIATCIPSGDQAEAWVYFYNAPLGGAQRIASGDYLEYLNVGSTAGEGASPRDVRP